MWKITLSVLKRNKYALIASLVTLAMFALSYYLTVATVFHKNIIIYAEMNGLAFTVVSLLFSLIIAVLFGAYIALLFFRRDAIKARKKANKATSSLGALTGIIASGCPSCGAPLLGLIGLPLGLLTLPLKGIELKILSILLLFLSIYLIIKNIKKGLICVKK